MTLFNICILYRLSIVLDVGYIADTGSTGHKEDCSDERDKIGKLSMIFHFFA